MCRLLRSTELRVQSSEHSFRSMSCAKSGNHYYFISPVLRTRSTVSFTQFVITPLVFNKNAHTPNTYFRTFIGLMTTLFALTGLFFFESWRLQNTCLTKVQNTYPLKIKIHTLRRNVRVLVYILVNRYLFSLEHHIDHHGSFFV
jgi:hypothetical protein